nr:phosphodiester glycosidase family protein [Paenibacillus beijingensis]
MNMTVQQVNRFFLLALAPFIGMMLWLLAADMSITIPQLHTPKPNTAAVGPSAQTTGEAVKGLQQAAKTAAATANTINRQTRLYEQTNRSMSAIARTAAVQAVRPEFIYNRRITAKLGAPARSIQSDKLTAQLYVVRAQNFSGYALKVRLKSDKAMKLALGKDKFGGAETTLAAASRYGAVAGVNAGGFADGRGGRYPLSTTVLDGRYVGGFEPTYADLFFVGLNDDRKLIGGQYSSKSELDRENPQFGVSFVPVLLKNGRMTPIPEKWQTSPYRAPRTVMANYKDDQLLFLVVDGRNENGSSGATLAEMQILASRLGAVDAYNLDGGGSSSLIFDGRVVNHPSDGRLRPLATNFLFFK